MVINNFDFAENSSRDKGSVYTFFFGNDPFVVTIFCTKSDEGYIADWVISGPRRRDAKPRFLLRVQTGISAEKSELEDVLWDYWTLNLLELAQGSANQGGFDLYPNALPKGTSMEIANFHLFAHDRLHHFEEQGITVAIRTADMFLLVKSLGYIQAQKLIIDYEAIKALTPVPASTTTNRLTTARKLGLIPKLRDNKINYSTQSENYNPNE